MAYFQAVTFQGAGDAGEVVIALGAGGQIGGLCQGRQEGSGEEGIGERPCLDEALQFGHFDFFDSHGFGVDWPQEELVVGPADIEHVLVNPSIGEEEIAEEIDEGVWLYLGSHDFGISAQAAEPDFLQEHEAERAFALQGEAGAGQPIALLELVLHGDQLVLVPAMIQHALPDGLQHAGMDRHADELADQQGLFGQGLLEVKSQLEILKRRRRIAGGEQGDRADLQSPCQRAQHRQVGEQGIEILLVMNGEPRLGPAAGLAQFIEDGLMDTERSQDILGGAFRGIGDRERGRAVGCFLLGGIPVIVLPGLEVDTPAIFPVTVCSFGLGISVIRAEIGTFGYSRSGVFVAGDRAGIIIEHPLKQGEGGEILLVRRRRWNQGLPIQDFSFRFGLLYISVPCRAAPDQFDRVKGEQQSYDNRKNDQNAPPENSAGEKDAGDRKYPGFYGGWKDQFHGIYTYAWE